VSIQRLNATLMITVEDNGVGFADTPKDGGTPGLGLIGIRERASYLGGTVRIETGPGRGTQVTVELPARQRPVPSPSESPDTPRGIHIEEVAVHE
jgi:signal transduction histidine kinase